MRATRGFWIKALLPVVLLGGGGVYALSRWVLNDAGVEYLRVEVLQRFPHDPAAFTQGLELYAGKLYESTGLYGSSSLRIADPATGSVQQRVALPAQVFGEGLTRVGDQLWQISWQEQVAYRWDLQLRPLGQVSYQGEGWGICYDAGRDVLFMSDGSADLTLRDPQTFAPRSSIPVTLNGEPLENINELECVDGTVWANIWQTERIVRIDPNNGKVTAVVDAAGLLTPNERRATDVLNGIAWNALTQTFLITGKLWPWLFEVRFVR